MMSGSSGLVSSNVSRSNPSRLHSAEQSCTRHRSEPNRPRRASSELGTACSAAERRRALLLCVCWSCDAVQR